MLLPLSLHEPERGSSGVLPSRRHRPGCAGKCSGSNATVSSNGGIGAQTEGTLIATH